MKMICVAVWAKTADELVRNIKEAEELADVIEVRFDSLDEDELEKGLTNLPKTDKILLGTFRPREQGGLREISIEERREFWGKVEGINWADVEPDMKYFLFDENLSDGICSHHDFSGVPLDLENLYGKLQVSCEAISKIAINTKDAAEGLPIWKLLKKIKTENGRLIPIAMGEAGKWTRILGLAYGAPVTYASLETGKEVAPGQLSVKEMRDIYRVKELTEETEIYGVIANPVSHSLSPHMQNAAFKEAGLDAVLVPFEVKDLNSFITEFIPESGLNLKGFAVTIPHKEAVMKYCHEIDETVQKIGAVNTVKIMGKITDAKLYGYNTDAAGFISPLKKAYGDLNGAKAAVLGAGGAARACIYALQKEGAKVTVFARDTHKARPLIEEFQIELKLLSNNSFSDFDVVVNTTPLGMKGKFERETPSISSQLEGVRAVYDLVYTPELTPFLQEASNAGVPIRIGGLEMLVAQGAEQFRIWTGTAAPLKEMDAAVRKGLR